MAVAGGGTYVIVHSKSQLQEQFEQWEPGMLDRVNGPNYWDLKDQYDRLSRIVKDFMSNF